jgi:hypothetical protein
MKKPTGYVLYENANIAVIATLVTDNPKTGDMVQVWILNRDVNPVEAIRTGQDDVVCFDCKHRGFWNEQLARWEKRTCYVRVYQAPRAVWVAYQNGRYPVLGRGAYREVFTGRKVRFGAYGEPILIPLDIMRDIAIYSDGWTGYTHQWSNPEYLPYSAYIMASVDTAAEYVQAKRLGWRTFRTRTEAQAMGASEIMCPASDEAGHKTTCADCRLCAGTYAGDPRKDIAIVVHGSGAKNFIALTSIGGAR